MYFLAFCFIIHFLYTLSFAIWFNRTATGFGRKQMIVHNIMIWVFPIIWIIILKAIEKPTLGRRKQQPKPGVVSARESIGAWAGGFYTLFHGRVRSSYYGGVDHETEMIEGHEGGYGEWDAGD